MQNIAVIGSGISGLSAAWLLSKRHRVTLYEADHRLGGHANTVDVQTPDGTIGIDTGFIVYNELNYPNLTALFRHLDVPVAPTEMSFALSKSGGAYEYAGSDALGFFGQKRNLARPSHWQLYRDISRFFKSAQRNIGHYAQATSLGEFLKSEGYGSGFIENHIVPMGAAIWSTPADTMLDFPARSFIDFYANHGLLQMSGRPLWHTVRGGSREYVRRILDDSDISVLYGQRVSHILRQPSHVAITGEDNVTRVFDQVVIATHADTALRLLDKPDAMEIGLLDAFKYQRNHAVLHTDLRWMPKRKRVWASWNYLKRGDGIEGDLCVTYWMNRLQDLQTNTDYFVTLNPDEDIHPKAIAAAFDYDHPVFDGVANSARRDLWGLQGRRRTWFCGSYFGSGFHEDGAQSGLAVAEQLGGVRRPWEVENESGRIALQDDAPLQAAE